MIIYYTFHEMVCCLSDLISSPFTLFIMCCRDGIVWYSSRLPSLIICTVVVLPPQSQMRTLLCDVLSKDRLKKLFGWIQTRRHVWFVAPYTSLWHYKQHSHHIKTWPMRQICSEEAKFATGKFRQQKKKNNTPPKQSGMVHTPGSPRRNFGCQPKCLPSSNCLGGAGKLWEQANYCFLQVRHFAPHQTPRLGVCEAANSSSINACPCMCTFIWMHPYSLTGYISMRR